MNVNIRKNIVIVMIYFMLLRVVLYLATGISIFNIGLFLDFTFMLLLLAMIASLIKQKVMQKTFYMVIIVFFTIILITDIINFQYFDVITSRSNLIGITRLGEGNAAEYSLDLPSIIYFVIPSFLITSFYIITNKKIEFFSIKYIGALFLIIMIQFGVVTLSDSFKYNDDEDYYKSDNYLTQTMYSASLFSEKYGYFNYHLFDLIKADKKVDKAEAFESINQYFDEKEDHLANEFSDLYSGYNVITIVGETLETRFIDGKLTPNLYMMLHNGYSFDNYFTPVYQQGATCNTEFMSLTGMNAIQSNYSINNVCDSFTGNTYTYSLPNQLESIGYETYYFHSGYEWFYNRNELNVQYGFSTSKFQEDILELGYTDFNDRFDTDMMHFLNEYVDYDELFYLDLLTYSGHGAYNQDEFSIHNDRVEEAYPNIELNSEIINYMEKLVELDNLLGLVIEELTLHGVMENTLFVIYPDHYPYMFDQEMYSSYIGEEEGSHEIMRQDLIIYAENMTREVIDMTGSSIDITPTILNLVDSSLDLNHYFGKDLFSNMDNYVLFSDLTITDGSNYYNYNEDYSGLLSEQAVLDDALYQKLIEFELQKQLLEIDYYKMLDENEE